MSRTASNRLDCLLFEYVRLLLVTLEGTTRLDLGGDLAAEVGIGAVCESGTSTAVRRAEPLAIEERMGFVACKSSLSSRWVCVGGKGKGDEAGTVFRGDKCCEAVGEAMGLSLEDLRANPLFRIFLMDEGMPWT